MSLQNINQKKVIAIDKISTLHVSLEARGPISWCRLIELDKLNNFCYICLYKIFTRKKLLPSKNIDKISILQASHDARGPFSWYRSIEHDKVNNFCYICLYKIFKIKKLWCKTFLKIRRHGGCNFRVQVNFVVLEPRSMKIAP